MATQSYSYFRFLKTGWSNALFFSLVFSKSNSCSPFSISTLQKNLHQLKQQEIERNQLEKKRSNWAKTTVIWKKLIYKLCLQVQNCKQSKQMLPNYMIRIKRVPMHQWTTQWTAQLDQNRNSTGFPESSILLRNALQLVKRPFLSGFTSVSSQDSCLWMIDSLDTSKQVLHNWLSGFWYRPKVWFCNHYLIQKLCVLGVACFRIGPRRCSPHKKTCTTRRIASSHPSMYSYTWQLVVQNVTTRLAFQSFFDTETLCFRQCMYIGPRGMFCLQAQYKNDLHNSKNYIFPGFNFWNWLQWGG